MAWDSVCQYCMAAIAIYIYSLSNHSLKGTFDNFCLSSMTSLTSFSKPLLDTLTYSLAVLISIALGYCIQSLQKMQEYGIKKI